MHLCHPLKDQEDLKRAISGKLDWQGNAFLPVLCPLVELAVFLRVSKVPHIKALYPQVSLLLSYSAF